MFLFAIILVANFSLIGCGGNSSGKTNNTLENKSTEEGVQTTKNEEKNSNEDVVLSKEEKDLWIFLSHITAIIEGSSDFPEKLDDWTDQNLIEFGAMHEFIYNQDVFTSADDARPKVDKKYVDNVVGQYFEKTISKPQSVGDEDYFYIEYQDNSYVMYGFDPNFRFAQVEKIIDEGQRPDGFGNIYTVYLNAYGVENFWGDGEIEFESPDKWEAYNSDIEPGLRYKAVAKIVKGTAEDGDFCFLTEFKIVE